MVDRSDPLAVVRPCQLLDVSRSTFYYQRQVVSNEDLELLRLLDECYLQHPYYGSRRIRDWLEDHDRPVNRKRVQRLIRQLGRMALYPKRNLSRRNQAPGVPVSARSIASCKRFSLMQRYFSARGHDEQWRRYPKRRQRYAEVLCEWGAP